MTKFTIQRVFKTLNLWLMVTTLSTSLFVICEHAKYKGRNVILKPSSKNIHLLTPYNFAKVEDTFRMSNQSGEQIPLKKGWLIAFQSHLCQHCKNVQPFWEKFADTFQNDINFGQVNCAVQDKNLELIDNDDYQEEG